MVRLGLLPSFRLEVSRHELFLTVGRWETYIRGGKGSAWFWHRDAEGDFEGAAGRLCVTLSRVPVIASAFAP